MSDETLHPDPDAADETLASLYVDDRTSAPERAQVESSPQLMALVEQFHSQRQMLADVPAPPDAARETAVAAALAQFTMVAPPPNVVSIDRRRRTRWMSAAAAVILIGVGGVVVANLDSGSDDTSFGVTAAESGDAAKTTRDQQVQTVSDASGGTEALARDTTAGSPPEGGAQQPTATIDSINGPVTAVPEVHTQDALRNAGATGAVMQPSFEMTCALESAQEIVAEITWNGTPAVVVRDTVSGVITALDAQCTALATVTP